MIVYERIESPANGFETRFYTGLRPGPANKLAETSSSFSRCCPRCCEIGPQNRVKAATFATQRRSGQPRGLAPTSHSNFIPPFNRFVFIFFIPLKNNWLQILYELAILFKNLLPKTA